MRSTKKTVSLFQSHVFKHEFFCSGVARSLFPLNHKTSWKVGNSVPLGRSWEATQGILIPVNLKMRNHSHLCGE
jgi:hypothetical protein